MKKQKKSVRLPTGVTPTRYSVHIKPDLDAFTFEGEEIIAIHITKATKTVTLHAAALDIRSAELVRGSERIEGAVRYDAGLETATITFPEILKIGKASLALVWTGILNDEMRGLYRSRYTHDGKEYHMATTQFESTDARRALPCFDEPEHKAVYDVTLTIPKDRTAISNTHAIDVKEHGVFKTIRFAPSPKMSSYLLAFIVGHFEHIEATTKRGVKVRVYVTPGKKHQATFALECAVKCLEFYEGYFGIAYPLATADLIAIPDFASGAMENWGAVTYRESVILVDEKHSTNNTKKWVALVIAHELAHQWFGNLVTMRWWTDLWLNEGFASYLEYVAVDAVHPEWHIWDTFVHEEGDRAMRLDSLKSTHPIEVEVHHPNEISEVFDAISYAKGAYLIRMLEHYIGTRAFRKGLSNYLKQNAYDNASTQDLWAAFERASGKPVAKIMNKWTKVGGYPLVDVAVRGTTAALIQSRYISNTTRKNDKTLWPIPLTIEGESIKTQTYLMDKKRMTIPAGKGWLNVNDDETAYIRVRYDDALLQRLGEALDSGRHTLGSTDRYAIIRDAFALADSGHLPTARALSLLKHFEYETAYVIWSQIVENLLHLKNLYFGTKLYERFLIYAQDVIEEIYTRVGFDAVKGEAFDQPMLRSLILNCAMSVELPDALQRARVLFGTYTKTGKALNPNIRGAVYAGVAIAGSAVDYKTLKKKFETETLEEERDRLLRALSMTRDAKELEKIMIYGYSARARGQDALKVTRLVWSNPHGRDVAWKYVSKNWTAIAKRFGGGHAFPRFIPSANGETSDRRAHDIETFFKKHKTPGLERTNAQTCERIRANAARVKRDIRPIDTFLSA
ncbi:MAG: M1 family metallopeptidase [Patescibacteria group bacterium]